MSLDEVTIEQELTFGREAVADIAASFAAGKERENTRWEGDFSEAFIEAIRDARLFIDCGAEYGFYCHLALKYGPPDLRIVAFEPESARWELLRQSVPMRVDVCQIALSDAPGSRTAVKPRAGWSLSLDNFLHTSGERVTVFATALDAMMQRGSVDVIKMDIEGAEDSALRGMKRILAESPGVRLFVEFHPEPVGQSRETLIRELRALGFSFTVEQESRVKYGGRVVLTKE